MKKLTFQMADVTSLMDNVWMQRGIQSINLLLLVWICALNATLIWNLVAEPVLLDIVQTEINEMSPVEESSANELISQLPGWHIFGKVRENRVASEMPSLPPDIPDTHLKLILRGVLAANDAEWARAIVANPNGNEKTHALGDRLSGEATLEEIYPDRIILMRGGRYETLRLPLDDEAAEGTFTTNSRLVKTQNTKAIRPGLKHLPTKPYLRSLTHLVRLKQLRDNNIVVGYTLHPGSDPDFFKYAGLHNGDRLISINGIDASTGKSLFRGLQSTKDGKPVTMHIQRNSQEKTLTFNLP
jgi:general secretion pathway protein C